MRKEKDADGSEIYANGVQAITPTDESRVFPVQVNGPNLYLNIISIGKFGILIILIVFMLDYRSSCEKYIDMANYEKNNQNFLQASENYHHAFIKAKKLGFFIKNYQDFLCSEADCYLMQALKEDDEDVAGQYYAHAANIYSEIINDTANKETELLLDALVGLSFVYNFSGHIVDKEWTSLIEQIMKEAEKLDKLDLNVKGNNNRNQESLCRWMKICEALGDFYYALLKTDYSYTYNVNIVGSALVYYEKFDILLGFISEGDKNFLAKKDPVYFEKVRAELMILMASSPTAPNHEQYAMQAIELCQSTLKDASVKNISMESYIQLRSTIAAGYRVLAEGEQRDEYMKKAYEEWHSLLDLQDKEIPLEQMVDIGYSALFTGFCADEDIEKILENYQKILLQYNVRNEPKETARLALNICDACMQIIECYGFSKQAWELGKYISEEVKAIEEYVQKSQKERFDEFYEYFHQNKQIGE